MLEGLLDRVFPARKALFMLGYADACVNRDKIQKKMEAIEKAFTGSVRVASQSSRCRGQRAYEGDVLLASVHPTYLRGFMVGCVSVSGRGDVRFSTFSYPGSRHLAAGHYLSASLI